MSDLYDKWVVPFRNKMIDDMIINYKNGIKQYEIDSLLSYKDRLLTDIEEAEFDQIYEDVSTKRCYC